MPSLNKVSIIGHVGRDPSIATTQSNMQVANFSVATTRKWKDKATGEWQEDTQWHRIVAWGWLAERAERDLHKGSLVYIGGRLETRKWTGKDGQDRYTTEIKSEELFCLDRREKKPAPAPAPAPMPEPAKSAAPVPNDYGLSEMFDERPAPPARDDTDLPF